MLSRYLLILCLILSTYNGNAQILDYVKSNYKEIKSISPSDTNYADLEIIGNAIGDARIVMLGEQDHGDAPAFLAKTRLIKYLHEKKGFDVLAFESDFFALTYGWNQLEKTKQNVDTFLRYNVFGIWTKCDACVDLFYQYIPATQQTATPVKMMGFDSQAHARYSKLNLFKYLDSIIHYSPAMSHIPIKEREDYLSAVGKMLDSFYRRAEHLLPIHEDVIKNSAIITSQFHVEDTCNFSFRLLKSFAANAEQFAADEKKKKQLIRDRTASIVRDQAMADNFVWLVNNYPDEKIIVWAHNNHIMKNCPDSLWDNWYAPNFGSAVEKQLDKKDKMYILGFTSYSGKAGRIGQPTYNAGKPWKESFENSLPKELNYAFIDFTPYNQNLQGESGYFMTKGNCHGNRKAKWNRLFDGFFYIRDMYPCKDVTLVK